MNIKCPTCSIDSSSVLSTRTDATSTIIYRRRKCIEGHRYTTVETVFGTLAPVQEKKPVSASELLRQLADLLEKSTIANPEN